MKIYENLRELLMIKRSFSNSKPNKIPKNVIGLCDPSNAFGIIAKNEDFRIWLLTNFEGNELKKVPDQFVSKLNKGTAKSEYSTEYLSKIFKVVEELDQESIRFVMATDYPLKIETENFDLLLAPRVD